MDIEKLLDLWGATESLPGEDMLGYRSRVHPKLPGFPFVYPARHELARGTVLWICGAIREMQRRLGDP